MLKLIRYVWKILKYGVGKRWIDFARNEVLYKTKNVGNNLRTI
jgi:hypothetical protein